ncbi:carbohydrate ABC transporter permease [Haladaptatus sp. NG-SE-30]
MSTRYTELLSGVFDQQAVESKNEISWASLVVPKIVLFGAILILPFFMAVWISLHEWDPISPNKPFVGLEHYVTLLRDPLFHNAIINTAGYAAALVFVGIPISLFLAVLLDKELRGTSFYSGAIFLPVVTSWVVVSLIWMFIFNPDFGLMNRMLDSVGLPTLEWLRSTKTALASIALMSIWKNVGFNMVIFLAGLRSIPDSYYEAARIDGANAWEQFRYITLPLLKSTTFFVVVVTMISSFRLFTQVFVMTEGGPVHSTYSIVFYFYQKGFAQFEMGYASALAVVLFVIVFALSILQQYTWGDDVEY